MATLKLLAKVIYVLTLVGSFALLAYFTGLMLGLVAQQNGFWSANRSESAVALSSLEKEPSIGPPPWRI